MRVLQILHTDELGGVKTLADMIAEDLGRRGVTVDTVLLFDRPDFGRAEKIKAAVAMARRLAQDDHDAIFAYQATACILTGLFGRKLRIVHQTCTPGETQALVRLADRLVGTAGRYSVNVANTMFTLNEFRGYPEGYRTDMRLIEHGLDAPRAASGREETRRRFGLPEGAPLILNVGRMAAQKNQSVLIEALPAVPDATLAIAGHGGDGDMLTALAQRHGVADRLRLLGGVAAADVADLYAAADLFAFPSVWETFGLAGVEAAMSGAPIVASDIAVLREVLASEEPDAPVAFAPPHDVDAWRRALAQALATPASAERRAAFADEVSRRYARERMSAQYMELLEGRDLPAPPW
ncbi:glycosyltransferase involved in cell wall biosynthesis [Methylopila capsulata]|uniref:Glycosyl transferase family 1 n=1 Tax=Methylopila capsulata TaxID=61654 RepID=A0A9W6IRU4_9HYPH|nr:glycosyltransferase family 4 protein [Methylopila capsulata]MBM7851963.1 glycosyltransferase involved in cell wall biosynthesis [Methylopila capsulata]GLK55028.1 glycosyl transferase family 1 [Methylopila capsulata]